MTIRRCPRGHRITGRNALKYRSRGRWLRRCRQCKTVYMRRYMRRRRARLARRGRRR